MQVTQPEVPLKNTLQQENYPLRLWWEKIGQELWTELNLNVNKSQYSSNFWNLPPIRAPTQRKAKCVFEKNSCQIAAIATFSA